MFCSWFTSHRHVYQRFRQQASIAAVIAATFTATAGPALAQMAQYPAFPDLTVPAGATGEAAIQALGTNLPAVAAWYGWSPDALKTELRRTAKVPGKTLELDDRGQLLIKEGFDVRGPGPTRDYGYFSPRDVTRLHSKPDATRKIVLVFGGTQLFGTRWNGWTQSGLPFQPFDTDGNPAARSVTELKQITKIWQGIADDFAPFDVDVTTEDVPDADLHRSGPDDTRYGIRVVIHSRAPDRCICDASVYVRSFGDALKPILLNATALGNGDPGYVVNAASHLIGHSLGLREDFEGRKIAPGVTQLVPSEGEVVAGRRIAPVMGDPFRSDISRFMAGTYPNAQMAEHDFVVMEAAGLPMRADLEGSSRVLASYLPQGEDLWAGGTRYWVSGTIERPGDSDVFAFHAGAGLINVVMDTEMWSELEGVSSNLNFEFELWNTQGIIAKSELKPTLTGVISLERRGIIVNLPVAGTYYINVRPVRERDGAKTPEFGNRGAYAGFIIAQRTTAQPPVAVLTGAAGVKGQSITLRADQSSDDRGITGYRWDFGDGSPPVYTTVPTVSKVYAKSGTFTATVQVIDRENFASTASAPVMVLPQSVPVSVTLN